MGKLLKFNVKNVKYAVPDASGSYAAATIKSMGGANSLSLEGQYNEKEIPADGAIAWILASDKGLNGKLSMVYVDDDYEIAMGRKKKIVGGTADVKQLGSVYHAIYFEVDGVDENNTPIVIKTWMFKCTSSKPSETYSQDTDSKNPNNYESTINVLGTNLQAAATTDDYVDANGNTLPVWKLSATPSDTNYDTFGASVPTPKALA